MNFSKFLLVLLSIGFVTTSMDKPAQPKPARPLPPTPTTKPATVIPKNVWENLKKQFQEAIKNNNAQLVKKYLNQAPKLAQESYNVYREYYDAWKDRNRSYFEDIPALRLAIESRNIEIVEAVIDALGDVNKTLPYKSILVSPLEFAIREARDMQQHSGTPVIKQLDPFDIELIKLLLSKGANPNYANYFGQTPLMLAAERSAEFAKLLLENGANVNARDQEGNTALIRAAEWGNADSIKLLLSTGTNPNLVGRDGKTALMYAIGSGNIESVKLLLSYSSHKLAPQIRQEEGRKSYFSLLPPEIAHKVTEFVSIDPNVKDNKGKTALDYAEAKLNDIWRSDKEKSNWKEIIDLLKPITKK